MTNLDARSKLCIPITNVSTKVHGIVVFSVSDPDPAWIRIQMGQWIRGK